MKLSDYIKGLRKGKEAHRLEKESMQDPFLADALDGYQQVEGDHERRLEQLRSQISARTSKVRFRRAVSWSVAACLALGIGISSYFLFMKSEEVMPPLLFEEEMLAVAPSEEDSVSNNDTTDIRNVSKVSEASTSKTKKASSDVLAQTKHVQHAPAAVATTTEPPLAVITEESAEASKQVAIAGKNLVKGKVVDEHNEPVIGAVVTVKETDSATLTNTEGQFELETPKKSVELTRQYIAYIPVEQPADSGKNMLIAMREDSQALEEVIVMGYGAKRKLKKETSTPTGTIVDDNRMPEPVIGKPAFKKYLKDNLIHPSDEACKDSKGIVSLAFYIDKDGNPERITVTKGLCESADQEAVRLVKEGPKWTPGKLPVMLDIEF